MKKIFTIVVFMLLINSILVFALTSGEAKSNWAEARKSTADAQKVYTDAKLSYAANASQQNQQNLVNAGKEVLLKALSEVEAWLIWKKIEANENQDVPDSIKQSISSDVDKNLALIPGLKTDVQNCQNQLQLTLVFLNLMGKYADLLSDVARNSGNMWAYIGETKEKQLEDLEAKVRATAEKLNNSKAIDQLNNAKSELIQAKSNIDNAKTSYSQVKMPGNPLIKFNEGNNYLINARGNLLIALADINQAFNVLALGGKQ
jgi:hypothetical protein